jgi:hypothetical protein
VHPSYYCFSLVSTFLFSFLTALFSYSLFLPSVFFSFLLFSFHLMFLFLTLLASFLPLFVPFLPALLSKSEINSKPEEARMCPGDVASRLYPSFPNNFRIEESASRFYTILCFLVHIVCCCYIISVVLPALCDKYKL